MEKFVLFTTGGGSSDPLNWGSDEAALYSISEFKGMKPASSRTVDLFFHTSHGKEIVTLGVKNMTHVKVMKSITQALSSNQAVITVADVDNAIYCDPNIQSVIITSQENYFQTLTNDDKILIDVPRSNYSACIITNIDGADDVALTLQIVSTTGADITDTGVNANESDNAATTSSVTLTVDGSAATTDQFLNERVYKSDGTLYGVCTARNSSTEIVFGGGLEQTLLNNADLYTGARYGMFRTITIPANTAVKLEENEISFDNSKYNLYATSGDAGGQLTFNFIL
tara:strand:+ start:3346 stop:4197 length:852 start_codon:yes stop_codon:yes gene_type:complete